MFVPNYARPSITNTTPTAPNEVKIVVMPTPACDCPGVPSLVVGVCARCGGALLTVNEKIKAARTVQSAVL